MLMIGIVIGYILGGRAAREAQVAAEARQARRSARDAPGPTVGHLVRLREGPPERRLRLLASAQPQLRPPDAQERREERRPSSAVGPRAQPLVHVQRRLPVASAEPRGPGLQRELDV